MYVSTGAAGVAAGTGALAFTGFGITWFVVAAVMLMVSGMLLLRAGRRRGARH